MRRGSDLRKTVQTPPIWELAGSIRFRFERVGVIGATLTSALGSTNANHGSIEEDAKRKKLNELIRTSGLFDGVAGC
jgi:hypothetical protein